MTAPVRFSLVVPMYKSEPYLPDLLSSFDRLSPGPYEVEFVFVDDGSPDQSAHVAQEWLDTGRHVGQVLRQENGGVSSARNAGIAAATGDWIGLPDADDFVGPHYLDTIAKALIAGADPVLISTNVRRYEEALNLKRNSHPLKFKFADGTRVVDLDHSPQHIQSQAASALFRRDIIARAGARFIEDLHVAEDAIFVSEYLLAAPSRRVLMAANAHYFYRRRAAGDSAVDNFKTNPDFYFGRFDRGYLPLFEKAAAAGEVPAWLDTVFIYDLRWFFPREMSPQTKASSMTAEQKQSVLDGVARVLRLVADTSIIDYRVTWLGMDYRCFLLALKGSPLPLRGIAKTVGTDEFDTEMRYLFTGDLPDETFVRHQTTLTPVAEKVRTIDLFGQRLVRERIVWLPGTEPVELVCNGEAVPLEQGTYRSYPSTTAKTAPKAGSSVGAGKRIRSFARRGALRARAEFAAIVPGLFGHRPDIIARGRKHRAERSERFSRATDLTSRYDGAWVLMDKVRAAGDSAEYLYRHIQQNDSDLNAWFVLMADSPDWQRLQTQGFRLVGYGSRAHKQLLRRARVVLSSHLDVEMTNPFPLNIYANRARPWKYIYLQHGVLQHDLSLWFNRKPIDIITTASIDEHGSIVDDDTPYYLTSKQAHLTGLPRHDEVVRLAAGVTDDQRDVVLIAPTWRHSMLAAKDGQAAQRLLKEPFERSEFARNWLTVVNSARLAEAAQAARARVVFLPHPNFRQQIDPSLVADHVELVTGSPDVQELLTRCRAVITDYSSIFFEAALAGADVSYFQFDHDDFLAGGHTYVPGYWSYERHGFGPVTFTADEAVATLERQLSPGEYDDERAFYANRTAHTLPRVDGRAAERIVALTRSILPAPPRG